MSTFLPLLSPDVSIHALLVECDSSFFLLVRVQKGFNPRTPCGVRLSIFRPRGVHSMFQSTHSLWSATQQETRIKELETVSIHALLVECDYMGAMSLGIVSRFNPRTPCGVRPATYKGGEQTK